MATRGNSSRKPPATTGSQSPKDPWDSIFAAQLVREMTADPNSGTTRKNYNYSIYTKEQILKWLQNPSSPSNEKNLRKASNYMYVSSMQYNRLINYYAGLYTGAYVIAPLGFSREEVKAKSFKTAYQRVSRALELMKIPELLRKVVTIALRDGAFYGILLSDNTSAFVQQLDPDYCKITAICDGSFLYAVDMQAIQKELQYYPAEFMKMYQAYLDTGVRWQEVPSEISVCIKADDSIIDFTIPPFSAVMPSVYTIANTEALQETATELKNYKMVAGKIPLDDKGNPLFDGDMLKRYYQQIAYALGDNVGLALTPFTLDSITFENNANSDVDDVSNAVANFWSTAGTSGLLHGRDNDTAGVIKLAIRNDETYVLGMVQQLERTINRYLKTGFAGATKFKITILPVTIYNKEDYLDYYKTAASFGIGKSQYAATLGIEQNDISGLDYLEKEILDLEALTPLKNTYTTGTDLLSEPGRPESDEEDLEKEGESTRDNDTNANR